MDLDRDREALRADAPDVEEASKVKLLLRKRRSATFILPGVGMVNFESPRAHECFYLCDVLTRCALF
jgi:hypothetical protein